MSGMNTYGAAAIETASLGLTFLSADPSGSLMKLAQMMKIYCRFRFFNINFGAQLGAYLESNSKKFDPPTTKPLNHIVQHSNKYYGNLLLKKVALHIFEVNSIRIVIYAASWFLKLIVGIQLGCMKQKNTVVKVSAYLISISQKVHMIALNAVAVDLIPYCLITIFHTRDMPLLIVWSSAVFLALLVYDYCEIWTKGGLATIFEFKEQMRSENSSVLELRQSKPAETNKNPT